jgi:hypothetical protein
MIRVISSVRRNKLFRILSLCDEVLLDEINHSVGMRFAFILEIKTLGHLFDALALFVCIMLQNQLLKEQESTFVMHSLPELNLRDPSMRSPLLLTVIALEVSYFEFNNKSLLHDSAS